MRLAFAILLAVNGVLVMNYAVAQTMTQEQYDQYITEQTARVNETKVILDEPHIEQTKPSLSNERQALCNRIQAYQNILQASRDNNQLNMAAMMMTIAQNYLERQNQSMHSSGMSISTFCQSRAEEFAESEKTKP